MKRTEAYQLAVQLLDKHGLRQRGWVVDIDNAKRRFGVCRYRSRTIGLSGPLAEVNQVEQVRDTILHEIAHALVGPDHGHDDVWKAKCREIGAKPERCYTEEDTVAVAGKYRAVCGGCGKEYHRHKKLPRNRRYACPCQSHIKDWNEKKILEFSC